MWSTVSKSVFMLPESSKKQTTAGAEWIRAFVPRPYPPCGRIDGDRILSSCTQVSANGVESTGGMVSVRAQNVPPREIVLGIDFGTSTSSAAAFFDNDVHIVLDGGEPIVPSVVYVPKNGDPVVGTEALRHGAHDP